MLCKGLREPAVRRRTEENWSLRARIMMPRCGLLSPTPVNSVINKGQSGAWLARIEEARAIYESATGSSEATCVTIP